MPDQAESLRERMREVLASPREDMQPPRLIAVASGKGGVGKSNFALNYCLALQATGERIALVDADFGFANLDILLGVRPTHSLDEVLSGDVALRDALVPVHRGLLFASGSSLPLAQGSGQALARLAAQMLQLSSVVDRIVVDFGAGSDERSAELLGLCDEVILVCTPEPTAIADAYALMKLVAARGSANFAVVINRARTLAVASAAARRLTRAAARFLKVDVHVLGYLLEDEAVARAVMQQAPFVIAEPQALASRCIERIAAAQSRSVAPVQPAGIGGVRALLRRFAQGW
ncbi:MAG: P-loop NTPase [Firmicutes bacterium]|nr:P-loop NTPase [Bacillota bacterium]